MSPASDNHSEEPDRCAVSAEMAAPASAAAAESSPGRGQLAILLLLLLCYAGLSQYSATARAPGLGALLSVAPILLIAMLLAWRWLPPLATLGAAALCCAALWHYWPAVQSHYEWSDLLQQCGIYGLIAIGFARSLRPGGVPMCTQLAARIHGGALTPLELSYLRGATWAWTVFYGLLTASILGLFFVVSNSVWSTFVNFATFGLIILTAAVDHIIRHRVLPHRPGGGWIAAIRRSILG